MKRLLIVAIAFIAGGCKSSSDSTASPPSGSTAAQANGVAAPSAPTTPTPPTPPAPKTPAAATPAADDGPALVPQAKVVYQMIDAVARGDGEALRATFAAAQRAKLQEAGDETSLQLYKGAIGSMIEDEGLVKGEFKADDFTYSYEGDASGGSVIATFKANDRTLMPLAVVNEDGTWLIAEH